MVVIFFFSISLSLLLLFLSPLFIYRLRISSLDFLFPLSLSLSLPLSFFPHQAWHTTQYFSVSINKMHYAICAQHTLWLANDFFLSKKVFISIQTLFSPSMNYQLHKPMVSTNSLTSDMLVFFTLHEVSQVYKFIR